MLNVNACDKEKMDSVYKEYGYSYPLGPVIPRANPQWPPLWKGLVRDDLDRQRATAEIVLRFYLARIHEINPKGELITRMDFAFRNWWTFLKPRDPFNNHADGWQITQPLVRTLSRLFSEISITASDYDLSKLKEFAQRSRKSKTKGWAWEKEFTLVAHDPFSFSDPAKKSKPDARTNGRVYLLDTNADLLEEAVNILPDKLDKQVKALYERNEKGAVKAVRKIDLIFSSRDYKTKKQKKTTALPWEKQSNEVREHVQALLEEPAGEWNVFVLLFLKLLHIHMAWIVPPQLATMPQEKRREATRAIYYRPLLDQLARCAKSDHPLSNTAAGIHQTLGRVGLLMGTGPRGEFRTANQEAELDPRSSHLPDSLHIDSHAGTHECVAEVKAILTWKYESDPRADLPALFKTVENVAALAQEMASLRTDPFALRWLSSVEYNSQSDARTNCSRFVNDWLEITKGAGAVVKSLKGETLEDHQEKNISRLPNTWDPENYSNAQANVNKTVRAIQRWIVRPQELRLFFMSTLCLFDECELKNFQSHEGENA